MTIIDQLDQTVTTAVLGDDNSVAHNSLLEQFYAILITRLAQPTVYSQLLRADQDASVALTLSSTLFEQLWEAVSPRQLLINELAATHHVDTQTTENLLVNATPLAYQELKNLANGQFLPAFLQAQQPSIRSYLPVWAEEVILPVAVDNKDINLEKNMLVDKSIITNDNAMPAGNESQMVERASVADSLSIDSPKNAEIIRDSTEVVNDTSLLDAQPLLKESSDAIHANPSDYYDAGNSDRRLDIRTRNRKNDLIVRALILIGVLVAIGLVWVLVIKPNYMTPAEPIVTSPVVAAPLSEPVAEVLLPAELIVGVDDSGSLYACTATIGDVALQSALKQALNVSFGDQASICELTVQQGVANSLSDINIETLPNIFTLLRSVPFARLQLQNDTLNLEAPDQILLQRLLTDMRTLIPAMTITSAAPLPLANGNGLTDDGNNSMSMMNGLDNESANENMPLNNTYDDTYPQNNNDLSRNQNYQQSDDDTSDVVESAPPRNNNANNNFNNDTNNSSNNNRTSNASAGPISTAEVDDLASNTIVAEKLRNERPVDKNLVQDR